MSGVPCLPAARKRCSVAAEFPAVPMRSVFASGSQVQVPPVRATRSLRWIKPRLLLAPAIKPRPVALTVPLSIATQVVCSSASLLNALASCGRARCAAVPAAVKGLVARTGGAARSSGRIFYFCHPSRVQEHRRFRGKRRKLSPN